MQLKIARLCLDCEEIHDLQHCPVCASETFAYISRWVAAPERRHVSRPTPISTAPVSGPPMSKTRMGGYGVLGLALAGLTGWWWKTRERFEESAMRGAGELR